MGVPDSTAVLQVDLTIAKYATSFDCFGQYFRFLRRKFKVLLDFFVILTTWVGLLHQDYC